jgi:hypothetical protein
MKIIVNDLLKEIELVKETKTPLQAIVASLEGMKIRKDRSLLFLQGSYPKC